MESMPIVRLQLRIPALSAMSEDMCINTWHFSCVDTEEGTINAVQTAVVAWYEAVDSYKSGLMSWQTSRIKWYDLSEPEPRVPFYEELSGLTSASGTPTARELALCLSFQGEQISGAASGRRRGRIYFGPLTASAIDGSGLLTSAAVTAASTAGGVLLAASNAASDWAWVVYSPTSGTSYPVVDGWVDNAPDIQRRRGTDATVRTTF